MKIGIEAQRIFRPKKHGMDIYALELIKALQKIDTQNQYVVFVKPDSDVCLKESSNLKIVEVKGKTYLDWEQFSLPRAIKKENVDLMHFTSNTASLNISCPYLLTLHDIIYLEKDFDGGSLYQLAGHYYRGWIVPKVVANAKVILTVSEYERIRIQRYFNISISKIKSIYNAYNQNFSIIDEQEILTKIQQKYSLPDSFIFFLGNVSHKKNMKRVLEAYAQYLEISKEPLKLVLAESSVEEIKLTITDKIYSKIKGQLILTGYIPHEDLPMIYNLATVFLYPSLRESFGIPIIEAMACGTPVITSNTSAMPEVAGEAALLVNPKSFESISDGIFKVLKNNSFYNHLKYNGLSRAMSFSWENTAYKTMAQYEMVFNQTKIN